MTKQVLYLSPLPPPAGGIASWTKTLFERGLPDGWEPILVNTRTSAKVFARSRDRLRISEVRRWARILGGTAAKSARERPVVIHLNVDPTSLGLVRDGLCGAIGRTLAVPYVVHYRGNVSLLAEHPAQGFRRRLLRRVAGGAAANIVLNQRNKAFLEAELEGRSRVVYLPNYFDDRRFVDARPAQLADGQRPRVVFVGGLTQGKGAHDLIAAAAQLPELDFLLIGRHYPELQQVIDRATPNVSAIGEVTNDQVREALTESHVFVLPSRTEGFPMSVCEAMAAGLPVVGTDVGAIGEMIDDGVGGVVLRDFEVSTLVDGIRTVVADETRRRAMGQHNQDKARAEYAYPAVVERLTALYAEISS